VPFSTPLRRNGESPASQWTPFDCGGGDIQAEHATALNVLDGDDASSGDTGRKELTNDRDQQPGQSDFI
jgi:hypothetical protein